MAGRVSVVLAVTVSRLSLDRRGKGDMEAVAMGSVSLLLQLFHRQRVSVLVVRAWMGSQMPPER